MTTKPSNPILYGSLYMDRGERMPKAIDQIHGLRDEARERGSTVRGIAFDVLYSKRESQSEVERTVAGIEGAIHEAFSNEAESFLVVVSGTLVRSTAADGPRIARDWAIKYIESGPEAADAYLHEQTQGATPTERGIERRSYPDH